MWRTACDRERVVRWVARSDRELVGRAADVEIVGVWVAPGEVFEVVVVVVELVEVVGDDWVVVGAGAGAGAGAAAVVGGAAAVVGEPVELPDPGVEVETVDGAVADDEDEVVVSVVVAGGALSVVVEVLVMAVVVVVAVLVDDVVVDAGPAAAHELVSVSPVRADAAVAPSWLVTAASRSLWSVTPTGTVTPWIVVDCPVIGLSATTEQSAAEAMGIAARPNTIDVPRAAVMMNARTCLRITAYVLLRPALTWDCVASGLQQPQRAGSARYTSVRRFAISTRHQPRFSHSSSSTRG